MECAASTRSLGELISTDILRAVVHSIKIENVTEQVKEQCSNGSYSSDNPLKITVLGSEWCFRYNSIFFSYNLAISLAKIPGVKVTYLVPGKPSIFISNELNKKRAAAIENSNITFVEVQKISGFDDPDDWLYFPPQDLKTDIVVGAGPELGKIAQVFKELHQCKSIYISSDPLEKRAILLYVGAAKGKHKQFAKKFCQFGVSRSQLTVRSFPESEEELKRLFCEVDLAIMPSSQQGFGMVALAALSSGLPVLVHEDSGFGEALKEIKFGTSSTVDSEDASAWAKAIKRVRKTDRKIRLEEAALLRSKYDEEYSWEKQCGYLVQKMLTMVSAQPDQNQKPDSEQKA